jgi:hypothetical protein
MAFERPPGAIRFALRVPMQDDAHDVTPVGAFGLGVEQAYVLDEVLLFVGRQFRHGGRGIADTATIVQMPRTRC